MVKDKTPEMTKALNNLKNFLRANNLDPVVNWSKDPTYGKEYTKLINKVNLERDKLTLIYPTRDLKNEIKLTNLKRRSMKKTKKSAKEEEKVEKTKKLVKKEKKEEKKPARKTATKYDYPLIDGREMTSDEKKKYRMEQRKLAAGKGTKPEKKEKKSDKKVKEKAKTEKPSAKPKKEKKAKKEED